MFKKNHVGYVKNFLNFFYALQISERQYNTKSNNISIVR